MPDPVRRSTTGNGDGGLPLAAPTPDAGVTGGACDDGERGLAVFEALVGVTGQTVLAAVGVHRALVTPLLGLEVAEVVEVRAVDTVS